MSTFGGRIGRTLADSQPWYPPAPQAPAGAPNVLVVLFDDVGFSDLGCYGSPIRTPAIDQLASQGLRYTGFHTTAMCSTTRAALLTGRNHHSVGVGCLANFDSGFPGYRGKISRNAGTMAEILRENGYRNYMVGKWHVTPLTQSGATGPFDGWPLGRGFDRYYGFMDAETDQYSPELVLDNTHIDAPGTFADGYHLTSDLVDQSIRFIANHQVERPDQPWLCWLALGACHAPHQAPADLIRGYDKVFEHGWDVERAQRLARQIELGLVPAGTTLPPRNDGVRAWDECGDDERKVFTRLQAAYAAMLDHADQHIARLIDYLERSGARDDTLILLMSDNGASQEGGGLGFVNAMGPYNLQPEPMAEKLRRIDDIGGPDSHANFPMGWAMASNTPLRRYKQNTHGGGIRDPLIVSWPKAIPARGEIRTQFCHASDVLPTLLQTIGITPPSQINGVVQQPIEGESFAASFKDANAAPRKTPQYFEMFGHRGLWQDGWKAVAFHPPGTPFDNDRWELFHLDRDFAETDDLAQKEPHRLAAMIEAWWQAAEKHQVLPLDDRFGPRFAANALRVQAHRHQFVFHRGVGHVPTEVAPDVRSRGYSIEADVRVDDAGTQGVLIAHGDATSGYSLYIRDGRLVHVLNIGGRHYRLVSDRALPVGDNLLRFRMDQKPMPPAAAGTAAAATPGATPAAAPAPSTRGALPPSIRRTGTLLINGEPAGTMDFPVGFASLISWSGLDIGRDRGSPVSDYPAPFAFTGLLRKVTVTMDPIQRLDGEAAGRAEMGRQ